MRSMSSIVWWIVMRVDPRSSADGGWDSLRLTDIKADHYERKVTALESANAAWEEKYEEMAKKYSDVQKELEEFTKGLDNI